MKSDLANEVVGLVFNYLQDCDNKKLVENITKVAKYNNVEYLKLFNIVTDCICRYSEKLNANVDILRNLLKI